MSGSTIDRKALWVCTAALSLFLISCAGSREFYREVDQSITQGDYRTAIENVRSNQGAYGDKSTVLYNLDLGLLYHYAGESDSSTIHLFAAEKEIEELYTKSISLAAASVLLNDNVLPYEGEDFEKVLINVFLALNYAEKNQPDEALVEARKVDIKLREYAKLFEGKNKYQEDAFIRYLAGVLYEADGEVNDAFISYRKAYVTYQTYEKEYGTKTPSFLLDDLVRTATMLAFNDEVEKYVGLGGTPYKRSRKPLGTILVVAYAGKGPIKEQVRPTVSIPDNEGTIHTFQIALPKFVPRFKGTRKYDVVVSPVRDSTQASRATTQVAEDVTAIAARTLEDRLALIYLKSGGRALLKFLAAEKAKKDLKKNDSELLNVLGSIAVDAAVGATEQADVRTWHTLPAEFQLARLNVDPGDYAVRVVSSEGKELFTDRRIRVKSREAVYVIVDDVR
jgi:hypothetical protein